MDVDEELFWLWCGTECEGQFIGPHPSSDSAEADRNASDCELDHAVFRLSLRQMASKIPPGGFAFHRGFHDPTTNRTLITRPAYPAAASAFAYNALLEMTALCAS